MGTIPPTALPPDASARRVLPRFQDRGNQVLLAALALLTIAAWVLTIHQSRTMDMPMGVVARGVSSGDMAGMAGMPGMAASGMAGSGWSLNSATTCAASAASTSANATVAIIDSAIMRGP